ncbi:MAG: amino acid adenylation domain-containing protein [Williamsia herbipolensis]|nr:amino acid adenylation domain-containing protein [Williamsia herbipolensis]
MVLTRTTPATDSLFELFDAACRRHPHRSALIAGHAEWDLDTVRRCVLALAERLDDAGVGPEAVVAVDVSRGVWSVIAPLAILHAGGVYLPVDRRAPHSTRRATVERARPRLLIHDGHSDLTDLPGASTLDLRHLRTDAPPRERGPRPVSADAASITVFTSGSTGRPKGVVDTRRALVHHMAEARALLDVGFESTVLFCSAPTFDLSFYEMLLPTLSGARVVVAPENAVEQPAEMLRLISRHSVTFVAAVPTVLSMLTSTAGAATFPSVTKIVSCGERLDPSVADGARQVFPNALVVNAYGPAECMVAVSATAVERAPSPPISSGPPISGSSLLVLDAQLNPTAPDEVGDIYIAGAQLARGYLDDPVTTAARFVAAPFPLTGTRMYRTGDRGFLSSSGHVRITGRDDHQVKWNGVRIELGAIEHALSEHPDVVAAAVVPAWDGDRIARLDAHVVAGPLADSRAITSFTADRLARSHRPSSLTCHDAFPMTAGGKIARDRLVPAVRVDASTPTQAAFASDEARVAELVDQVAGHRPRSMDIDLVDAGVSSLSLIRLLADVHDEFRCAIPMSEFAADPTPRHIVRRLRGAAPDDGPTDLVHLRPGPGRPLILVSGAGAQAVSLAPLSRWLHPDHDVWCVQAHGLDRRGIPDRSVSRAAHRAVEDVRAALPRGPYVLCGFSFGGLVAHEMCRVMEGDHDEVKQVVLLDALLTPSPLDGAGDTVLQTMRAPLRDLARARWAITVAGPLRFEPEMMTLAFLNQSIGMTRRHRPDAVTAPITMIRSSGNRQAMSRWAELTTGHFSEVSTGLAHADFQSPVHAPTVAAAVDAAVSRV